MHPKDHTEELDLQKYWSVIKRRWFPAVSVFGAVMALSVLAAALQKPTYRATASLLVKTDRSSSLVGLPEMETGNLQALAMNNSPAETQAEILRSDAVAKAVITALKLTDETGKLLSPNSISGELKVKNVASTDVLQISFEDSDPEKAAKIVNEVINIYIQKNVAANRAETASAREFISRQLPRVELAVRGAEHNLRAFKEENQIVVLESEANAAVNIISSLDQKISDTQADLAKVAARSHALQNQLGMDVQQAAAMTTLSQASGIQEVLTQYQEAQSKLAVEQARYRSGHPTVTNLQRQVDSLKTLLQSRVGQVVGATGAVAEGSLQMGDLRSNLTANLIDTEIERSSLISQAEALRYTLSAYRDRASVLPRLAQTQGELDRKLKVAQSTYETLLTRLQEVQVAENQNVGNIRVISGAEVPDQPAGISKNLVFIAGGLAGLLLGLATAFLLDLFDRSIKTVQEAKSLFGYTLLGLIPTYGKLAPTRGRVAEPMPKVFPRDLPRSPLSEAYHMLQANLKFLNSDKEIRVVVVTSSVAEEGKSTVAANLAAAAVQVGRRVLLVDADMRYPQQHHIWDLVNVSGLSNVIVGQQDLSTVIQSAMPGLDLLTAGVIPPNPVALLDSKRMASLIETFSENYDLVILDTPALMGMADAAILGKMLDGLLLVVRPGVVDSIGAAAAKEFLVQTNQPVLGLVANGAPTDNEREGYFYHRREQYREQSREQNREDIESEPVRTQLAQLSAIRRDSDHLQR